LQWLLSSGSSSARRRPQALVRVTRATRPHGAAETGMPATTLTLYLAIAWLGARIE
jgi:hypothetical protein